MTLEKVSDNRTLGLTWVHGIDQDQRIASVLGARDRRDMNTWSARFSQNLDSEQLKFSGEYAYQDGNDSSNENAWYLQATKTFDTVPAKPSITYRYSQFSEKYMMHCFMVQMVAMAHGFRVKLLQTMQDHLAPIPKSTSFRSKYISKREFRTWCVLF